ncbi:MAG: carbohydrate binding family 9 domain-containing protein [Polyangiaceae bacterium]|nr:carbohydrate binding family 9 domain-containing protein [Polyangiaceae bacterium]
MLGWPLLAAAAAAATPHMTAVRVDRPPVLDGKLDEAVWRHAKPTDKFTQKTPDAGKPPSHSTRVRIIYDNEAIYVGVECEQRGTPVVARLTRRDRWIEADVVWVGFDTRDDGKSALEFGVNAAGVLYDSLIYNDTEFSTDWDEVWDARTSKSKDGWTAEFRIPLRILRFREGAKQRFGLQIRRRISTNQETDEWAFIPRDAGGEVSLYGKLDGLENLKAGAPIELRPFLVGAINYSESETLAHNSPFFPTGSVGLDIKWHPNQSLTLDATILPDFGQVEADQVILNLTNFEQFLPERRPFFLEGVDVLSTPFQLLYTRRLGRAPYAPALPGDETQLGRPSRATIYGAAKLTGEINSKTSIGEVLAVTAPVTVDVRDAKGRTIQRVAEPAAAFKILRLRRDINSRTFVGVTATAKSHLDTPSSYPRIAPDRVLCPDGSEVRPGKRCFHDAYVVGVDGRWRSPGGDYVLKGQAIGTLMRDGPPRTMADGTVISAGDVGPAVQAQFAKEGGKHWAFWVDYTGIGRKVDYNDVGYMQRQNLNTAHLGLQWRNLEPWRKTLEMRVFLDLYESDTFDGITQDRSIWLGNSTRYINFWETFVGINFQAPRYDDREVGDGTALERAGRFGGSLWFATDQRKNLSVNGGADFWFLREGVNVVGEARILVRPLPQFEIELIPTFSYTHGEPRYAGTIDEGHVFGRLRAQSLGLTLRSTYMFTPRLSLQAYGQAFLSASDYSDFKVSPARGRAKIAHLDDLKPVEGTLPFDPDSEGGTLNANVVLRWEYRLGSTFFLVYTHAQSDGGLLGTPKFSGQWISPRPSEETLLAKLLYWWS